MIRKRWRCFHCDEVMTTERDAFEHFGCNETCNPICWVDAAKFREQEHELERYRLEDSDKDREFYRMRADHSTALVREEEKGYAKGLADGRALVKQVGYRISDPTNSNYNFFIGNDEDKDKAQCWRNARYAVTPIYEKIEP